MRKINRFITLFTAFVLILSSLTINSGAVNLNTATTLNPLMTVSFSNSESSVKAYLFKIALSESGKIRFFRSSANISTSSKIAVLDSRGNTSVSGNFSDMISKSISISKKGTYYAQVTLAKSQSVKGFGYTYISNSGKNIEKSLSINVGKTYDCSSYVNGFGGSLKWTTSTSSVVKISTKGIITAVNAGTAKVRVYSSTGDFAQISVTVKNSETLSSNGNGTVMQKVSGGNTYTLNAGGSSEFNKYVGNLESYGIYNFNTTAKKGDSFKLKINSNGKISWESKNPYVATVDGSGNVKILRKGTASIVGMIGDKQYACWIDALSGDKNYVTVQSGKETLYGGAYTVARSEGKSFVCKPWYEDEIPSTKFDFIFVENKETETAYEHNRIYPVNSVFNGLKFTSCYTSYANTQMENNKSRIVERGFETSGTTASFQCSIRFTNGPYNLSNYEITSGIDWDLPWIYDIYVNPRTLEKYLNSYGVNGSADYFTGEVSDAKIFKITASNFKCRLNINYASDNSLELISAEYVGDYEQSDKSTSKYLQKIANGKTYNLTKGGSEEFNKHYYNPYYDELNGLYNYFTTAKKGDSFKLKTNVAGKAEWESKNPYVATVKSDGTVKVLRKGTAAVVATVRGKQYACYIDSLSGEKDIVIIQQLHSRTLYGGDYVVARSEGEKCKEWYNNEDIPSTSFDFIVVSNDEDFYETHQKNRIYTVGDTFNGLKFTKCKTVYANKSFKYGVLRDNIVRIEVDTSGSATIECKVDYDDDPLYGGTILSEFGWYLPKIESLNVDANMDKLSAADQKYLSGRLGKKTKITVKNFCGTATNYFGFTSVDITKIIK